MPQTVDPELLDLYVAETKLSPRVVAAFLSEGQEPPPRWRVDAQGYTAREVALIQKYAPVEA